MRSRRSAVVFAGLLVLAAGLAAAPSPAPAPPPGSPFGEEIDVRVVNVEVVVTDGKSERVTGLQPRDFTLTVDGKPVDVEFFSEVRDGRSFARDADTLGGETLAGDPGIRPMSTAAGGTSYLVFVDDYFSIAAQRDAVLKSLQKSLGVLAPQDRMAVVAYDGGRLAQLSGWTSSRDELAAALDRAMAREAHGFDRTNQRRSFARDEEFRSQIIADATPLDLNARGGDLNEAQSAYGITLIRQVQASAGAAVSAMRAYAAPEQRKVLLLLAGGWPYSARALAGHGSGMPRMELPEGDRVLKPLTDTANLLGYTIYPVDVPGQQATGTDVETTAPVAADGGASPLVEQEVEASLRFLAKETGGRPIMDGDRLAALGSASDDTRSFYWLGFVPAWRGDDKAHPLKVQVGRPGLQVRSRSNFLDLSRQAEVTMRLESALLLGNFPGALPMPIQLGEAKRTRRGQVEVPVTLGLPADLMTVVPVGSQYAAKLELRFAASDGKGGATEIPVLPVTLSSATPPSAGGFVRYETKITLRGAADHLVVAAYDPASDRMATAEANLALP